MADFDKWRKALGDAAYLRVQQDQVKRLLDAASAERDRLFLIDPNSAAYRNAQALVEQRVREVGSFTPRVLAADEEARREEPTDTVKRERYCANAARARQIRVPAATQAALDRLCSDLGGDPMAGAPAPPAPMVITNVNAPEGMPAAAPAQSLLLPIAAVAGLAVIAGGAYLWSQQRKATPALRRR